MDGPRARGVRVLLADDSAGRRQLLRMLLEELPGVRVVAEAADGASAVAQAAALRPDLAFLDIAMPVLDGLEALRRIRRCAPETKLVSYSADTADRMAAAAGAAGADAYLAKTAADEEIAAVVRRLCPADRTAAVRGLPAAGVPAQRRPAGPPTPVGPAEAEPTVLLRGVRDGSVLVDLVVERVNRPFALRVADGDRLVGQPWARLARLVGVPVSTAALLAAARTGVALSWTDGTAGGVVLRVGPAGDGLAAVLPGIAAAATGPGPAQVCAPGHRQSCGHG